jgi:SAM-dependent methyltransferase
MKYKQRACENCGLNENREAFSWEKHAHTRSRWHLWQIRNVVCPGCGFAFVDPAPTVESLNLYYADSHMLVAGEQINSEQRMGFLKEVGLDNAESVVEIGGNHTDVFATDIETHGAKYLNCEINAQVDGAVKDLSSMNDCSADFIVSYYVFEHLIDLPAMIAKARRVLKDHGTFVIEVPDISYYTHLVDAIGFYEHVNHFGIRTLCSLMARNGFSLKKFSREYISRRFGMVAAFVKCPPSNLSYPAEIEFADAMASLYAGEKLMLEADQRFAGLRSQILDWSSKGDNVVLWAANRLTQEVIGEVEIPGNCVLVDIDPGKSNFINGHQAFLPSDRIETIKMADRVIIFAEVHAPKIILNLKSILAERFNKVAITVFSASSISLGNTAIKSL